MRSRNEKKVKKVFVGMSGGVDSSVTAALLQKRGFDVVGVHIKCWSPTGDCGVTDAEDARRVAEKLEIPFYVWDFEKEYKKRVVDYMIEGYRAGLTPNPDIMCNREIKFGIFLEKALWLGADFVATGHYVSRIVRRTVDSRTKLRTTDYGLRAAEDKNKDQSYFLWTLTQKQLAHCLFPIGEYEKKEVREMARAFKLPTAEKKDSQGICFMGHITIDDFLKDYIPQKAGKIVTTTGDVIGEHHGVSSYTIGQRHGIRVGGTGPYYVTEKDLKTNTLIVASGAQDETLYRKEAALTDVHFIRDHRGNQERDRLPVLARVRYRQPLFEACLEKRGKDTWSLVFKEPQRFVAEGQSAVFYLQKGEMLGGGVITR
jgi:tRNA-specific 2-thiouridylase